MTDTLDKYFKNERLLTIPKKHHVKLEIFAFFHTLFEEDTSYTEQAINEKIKPYYDDYAIIRRYLVDYNFLKRDKFGQSYQKVRQNEHE